jgi:predicted enzyme related to lactoylglutathione lyase
VVGHCYLPLSSSVIAVTTQTPSRYHPENEERFMTSGIGPVIYPVKDLALAKRLYGTLLGVEPYVDEAYYVGYRVGDQEIGLDPHGASQGMTGPVAYFEVGDIEESLKDLLGDGAELLKAASDVGGGKLIASVKDADGNIIGLAQSPLPPSS